ncbi:MAG: glutamate--tRNA ligase family protein, partial [Bacteroidia bacterium]
MENRRVRVRFAPSPTGYLHIGGVRTALYNYLFAHKHGGDFLLRIEDTDQNRYVPGAEQYIMEALAWLGIEPVESPLHGGPHAPYRQSERKAMYRQYADQLINSGNAYYAFDTPEELEEMRKRLEAAKVASPQYNAITRNSM